jgi:CBS domain-containing protein
MSTTVLTIPQEMSLAGAAHLLAQANISGAPVVDADGRCVGVLSANDFVSWADHSPHAGKHRDEKAGYVHSAWQVIAPEEHLDDEVQQFMTPDPVMVRPATPLPELAQMMVDAHIHRIIVVDADNRPVGVVSSTDILAAVATAAQRSLVGKR